MADSFACPVCGGYTYVEQADDDTRYVPEVYSEHRTLHTFGLENKRKWKGSEADDEHECKRRRIGLGGKTAR
jgi:hypothetical protein